jgi:hypothetical protein
MKPISCTAAIADKHPVTVAFGMVLTVLSLIFLRIFPNPQGSCGREPLLVYIGAPNHASIINYTSALGGGVGVNPTGNFIGFDGFDLNGNSLLTTSTKQGRQHADVFEIPASDRDTIYRIVRALILRRVGLLESSASGPVIIGRADQADVFAPAMVSRSKRATASCARL